MLPNVASASGCNDPIFDIEGQFAQDTDGDGVATIAEGSFDIDQDGWFTQAEADALRMCEYINWKPDTNIGQLMWTDNSYCRTFVTGCMSTAPRYRCCWRFGSNVCWTHDLQAN